MGEINKEKDKNGLEYPIFGEKHYGKYFCIDLKIYQVL